MKVYHKKYDVEIGKQYIIMIPVKYDNEKLRMKVIAIRNDGCVTIFDHLQGISSNIWKEI